MNNSGKQSDRKVILGLSLASFLHDVGSDMVFSVWPLFVTSVLGANMAILGLIDGMGEAIVSVSGAIGGYISDKVRKRKIFIWTGYLFGGISRIGYAFSSSWPWLIPFRLLDRSGKIRGAPRDAVLSDISNRENRGLRFGILRAMDNFGAVVGILIAIFLLQTIGFKNLFMLAALPSFLAVMLIVIFIREPTRSQAIFRGIRFKDFDSNLRLLTILSGIFALGSFSYSFLIIFANKFGFKTFEVPILYLLFTLVAAIISIPAGKLADRIGRKKVLFVSYFFWAALAVTFIFFASYIGIILGFIFYGLHKGALEPVLKTLVAELAPKEYVASTIGAFQMVIGLVAFPASFLAGLLWDSFNPNVPFYFSLGLTIISTVMLFFVKEK
ncbi:MFS transporter [Candidatus Gottesmanbacteria bacterium]|nr:MFS transporter [Candidatus Gottesmanbacteria bacterium]